MKQEFFTWRSHFQLSVTKERHAVPVHMARFSCRRESHYLENTAIFMFLTFIWLAVTFSLQRCFLAWYFMFAWLHSSITTDFSFFHRHRFFWKNIFAKIFRNFVLMPLTWNHIFLSVSYDNLSCKKKTYNLENRM